MKVSSRNVHNNYSEYYITTVNDCEIPKMNLRLKLLLLQLSSQRGNSYLSAEPSL